MKHINYSAHTLEDPIFLEIQLAPGTTSQDDISGEGKCCCKISCNVQDFSASQISVEI